MSPSILTQLVRFMVSVDREGRAQSLVRATRGGEQTMIIDARANLELRDAAAKNNVVGIRKPLQRNGWEQTRLSFLSCLSRCMKHRKRYPEELL